MLPVGEEFDFELNGVKISARFFCYDSYKTPMDFMVISRDRQSTAYFLTRFRPVVYTYDSFLFANHDNMPDIDGTPNMADPYSRAFEFLKRYNPLAPDDKNNYYAK